MHNALHVLLFFWQLHTRRALMHKIVKHVSGRGRKATFERFWFCDRTTNGLWLDTSFLQNIWKISSSQVAWQSLVHRFWSASIKKTTMLLPHHAYAMLMSIFAGSPYLVNVKTTVRHWFWFCGAHTMRSRRLQVWSGWTGKNLRVGNELQSLSKQTSNCFEHANVLWCVHI